jgi:kinetochore protein Nuf2
MSKQFWFPPLANTEILSALSGWGLSVSNEQLAKPTSDFVLGVYTFCLRHVTGLSSDELYDTVQQSLSIHDDITVDMYSHAMARTMLCYHM